MYYVAEDPLLQLPRVRTAYELTMWTESLDIQVVSPHDLPGALYSASTQTFPLVLFWYISHFGNYGGLLELYHNLHVARLIRLLHEKVI